MDNSYELIEPSRITWGSAVAYTSAQTKVIKYNSLLFITFYVTASKQSSTFTEVPLMRLPSLSYFYHSSYNFGFVTKRETSDSSFAGPFVGGAVLREQSGMTFIYENQFNGVTTNDRVFIAMICPIKRNFEWYR